MKRTYKIAAMLAAGMTLFSGGYLFAQQSESDAQKQFMTDMATHRLEVLGYGIASKSKDLGVKIDDAKMKEYDAGPDGLSADYMRVADSPALTKEIVAGEIRGYSVSHEAAESAPQASQAAEESQYNLALLQVAQNARMIELLKEIAAQKGK